MRLLLTLGRCFLARRIEGLIEKEYLERDKEDRCAVTAFRVRA